MIRHDTDDAATTSTSRSQGSMLHFGMMTIEIAPRRLDGDEDEQDAGGERRDRRLGSPAYVGNPVQSAVRNRQSARCRETDQAAP